MPFLKRQSNKYTNSGSRRSEKSKSHEFVRSTSKTDRSIMNIILDDNDIYQGGQSVHGHVVIDLIADVPLSECYIKLFCIGKVGWTDNPGLRDEGHSYNIQRLLLEYFYRLDDGPISFFPAGRHEIPFEFLLPEEALPSSFQSRFGSISYTIEAKIGEHERKRDILVDMPITRNLWLTVGGTSEKDFGVLSFASGNISMQATLDKKGYFRGEDIRVNLMIDNNSSANVKPRVTFYQTQIYMTGERHKTVENSLTEAVDGDEVPAHSLVEDGSILVKIPVNIPLSIKSDLITLKYFVHVTLDIPLATDIHVNLPVIVTSRAALEN
ncbi:hypothetical protein RDWZM_001853 [Blomia tropicalis]|uniref:Arrestin C-terminal-like domain-containing protein n=1 Tax=Blomia tropicalis TaxID=40697 RepID=A0A9Q0MBH4_BLOTA|nr:Arrestin domain-containing protein 3 [Blomia tropicalis]KAJ6223308.1 hypothetical protein RDWZM_001853 [Blomia tropicalis]